MRLAVAEIVTGTLAGLGLTYPELDPLERQKLLEARDRLLSGSRGEGGEPKP
jgi:hypothetical protein